MRKCRICIGRDITYLLYGGIVGVGVHVLGKVLEEVGAVAGREIVVGAGIEIGVSEVEEIEAAIVAARGIKIERVPIILQVGIEIRIARIEIEIVVGVKTMIVVLVSVLRKVEVVMMVGRKKGRGL